MSRQLALDTICLKPTGEWAHTDYSLEYHTELRRKLTGLEPNAPGELRAFYDACQIDFLFGTYDGLLGNWGARGRATDMGHAEYATGGTDLRQPKESPFKTQEEVWAFDPAAEYGLPDRQEQIDSYQQLLDQRREAFPNQLSTGGYYKTIISGCIQAFGWEMLLLAAADRDKFETVMDRFFRFTQHHMNCWAETDAEVIIQHDDFVWTLGPFVSPEVYRKAIIPRFGELWKPLKAKGKKVLFCSDGTFDMFAEDLVAAGADGLIFEPMNDFGKMVDKLGDSTCLVGSAVDCRDLTFGTWETVEASLARTFKLLEKCRGVILATGNHLPPNIPQPMIERYLQYLSDHRRK